MRQRLLMPHACAGCGVLFMATKPGELATLVEVPRRWCAVDLDGVSRPDTIPATDLWSCAIEAIRLLPPPFHGAACIAVATAQHGLQAGSRLRLWFWLSRATSGADLTFWMRRTPADPAGFRTAQICYTAAPAFADGVRDHLPQRIAELPGAEFVEVPSAEALRPPPPPPMPPLPRPSDAGAARYAWAALRNATTRVANAPKDGRHAAMLRESLGLSRFVRAGLLSESEVRAALGAAAEQAGKPASEAAAVLGWALRHANAAPLHVGGRA